MQTGFSGDGVDGLRGGGRGTYGGVGGGVGELLAGELGHPFFFGVGGGGFVVDAGDDERHGWVSDEKGSVD